jgi:hypothetical protein
MTTRIVVYPTHSILVEIKGKDRNISEYLDPSLNVSYTYYIWDDQVITVKELHITNGE